MKCIECQHFYYRGGDYGYCRKSGKTIDFDNEETNCKYINDIDEID